VDLLRAEPFGIQECVEGVLELAGAALSERGVEEMMRAAFARECGEVGGLNPGCGGQGVAVLAELCEDRRLVKQAVRDSNCGWAGSTSDSQSGPSRGSCGTHNADRAGPRLISGSGSVRRQRIPATGAPGSRSGVRAGLADHCTSLLKPGSGARKAALSGSHQELLGLIEGGSRALEFVVSGS